jgi:hypothetical protein
MGRYKAPTGIGLTELKTLRDPAWEQQPGETDKWYERFCLYYCASNRPSGYNAHQRWKEAQALGEEPYFDFLDDERLWLEAETLLMWKKRFQIFQRYEDSRDVTLWEKRRAIQTAQTMEIVDLAIERAKEIMMMPSSEKQITQTSEDGTPLIITINPRSSKEYRDAMEMLKTANALAEDATPYSRADRYMSFLHAHGFEVTMSAELIQRRVNSLLKPAEEAVGDDKKSKRSKD